MHENTKSLLSKFFWNFWKITKFVRHKTVGSLLGMVRFDPSLPSWVDRANNTDQVPIPLRRAGRSSGPRCASPLPASLPSRRAAVFGRTELRALTQAAVVLARWHVRRISKTTEVNIRCRPVFHIFQLYRISAATSSKIPRIFICQNLEKF